MSLQLHCSLIIMCPELHHLSFANTAGPLPFLLPVFTVLFALKRLNPFSVIDAVNTWIPYCLVCPLRPESDTVIPANSPNLLWRHNDGRNCRLLNSLPVVALNSGMSPPPVPLQLTRDIRSFLQLQGCCRLLIVGPYSKQWGS